MITFNPGPSQLSRNTIDNIHDVAESGILSWSHRSKDFSNLSKQTIELFKQKMKIPDNFQVFYQPSATAAMETILRNLVTKKSFHFVHGAFSKRFWQTAKEIDLETNTMETLWQAPIPYENANIKDSELIAITHNETSSGLMWPFDAIKNIREKYPNKIVAIDVTSSIGAMNMPWNLGDVWFCSVQKCLGLPAGLGLIIIKDEILDNVKVKPDITSWQSLIIASDKMKKYQTVETPNVFGIALLCRQMEAWDLDIIERDLQIKAEMLYGSDLSWIPFVEDKSWLSLTTLNFKVDDPDVWHKKALENDMVLGKGYGDLKSQCIRIANFPAIGIKDIEKLLYHSQEECL